MKNVVQKELTVISSSISFTETNCTICGIPNQEPSQKICDQCGKICCSQECLSQHKTQTRHGPRL